MPFKLPDPNIPFHKLVQEYYDQRPKQLDLLPEHFHDGPLEEETEADQISQKLANMPVHPAEENATGSEFSISLFPLPSTFTFIASPL